MNWTFITFTSAKQLAFPPPHRPRSEGGIVFSSVCLYVCLFVCQRNNSWTVREIWKSLFTRAKLVAENLTKHLTNNKKDEKTVSSWQSQNIDANHRNFYVAGQIYRISSLKDHLAVRTLKTYHHEIFRPSSKMAIWECAAGGFTSLVFYCVTVATPDE